MTSVMHRTNAGRDGGENDQVDPFVGVGERALSAVRAAHAPMPSAGDDGDPWEDDPVASASAVDPWDEPADDTAPSARRADDLWEGDEPASAPFTVERASLAESTVDDVATPAGAKPLTLRQQQILTFERQWWKRAGSKEQAIREQFDLSATRYYQMLNALLEMPAAVAFDPLVVGRLRRLRATRARARSGR